MWGFTRHNLAPDIVTMGKPMGNGIPIAAVAATRPIFEAFAAHSPYFNTFGGNNIAIAAAQAVLDVIREERLIDHAREVGTYFRAQLRTLADGDPRLGQVRGTGLYIGLEIVADDAPRTPDGATAADIVNALRDRGVLTSLCGSRNNVLKLRPPLPFAARDVDRFITELDATLRCDVPVE